MVSLYGILGIWVSTSIPKRRFKRLIITCKWRLLTPVTTNSLVSVSWETLNVLSSSVSLWRHSLIFFSAPLLFGITASENIGTGNVITGNFTGCLESQIVSEI